LRQLLRKIRYPDTLITQRMLHNCYYRWGICVGMYQYVTKTIRLVSPAKKISFYFTQLFFYFCNLHKNSNIFRYGDIKDNDTPFRILINYFIFNIF